jgi:diguanylate cyclase (GGDEF)-like protein/putative nucleotidyltransferase with HDIG domain
VYWREQSRASRLFLIGIYLAAIPFAAFCFSEPSEFSLQWVLFTIVSLCVATVNVRLPTLSVVISMGDVFIIFILMRFGAGAALITYWLDIIVAHTAELFRRRRLGLKAKFLVHRWAFNFACCALSSWTMHAFYESIGTLPIQYPLNFIAALFSIAIGWFFVNTATLSMALSLWMNKSFWSVWREGIVLYLLNFVGSASAAGLISLFYDQAGSLIFILAVPIAIILYKLYHFSVEKYEQAQAHIDQLNKLYIQTVEALASAVDAKDRYTHGHIRRVQAYAAKLALFLGISNDKELLAIQAGALLHDIGKIAIPEYILNKPTVLTETEYEKMKIHPVVGANMLSTIEFPYPLVPVVRFHHERWDGTGYPDGLKGEEIPLNARILALVDCYDALTTNRPYRSPMDRDQVIQFLKREAGRSYDPKVVNIFIAHLEEIEAAGAAVAIRNADIWGLREVNIPTTKARPLDKVQPTLTYGKALNAGNEIQRELYFVFEFVRANFQCLTPADIFSFMGRRLEALIQFDAAVFFAADLTKGTVTATHAVGNDTQRLYGLTLPLEQKLTGWVAANNQALCNLPPFPDFLQCEEPKPSFQVSAIAPMNRRNEVFGAISLYRNGQTKFTDAEFRRLEIIASQTAISLAKCIRDDDRPQLLVDALTNLPNGFQLYLMFDQVAMDAARYEYPLAFLSISLDDIHGIRQKWGHISGDEAIRTAARYLKSELRETDLLVRYTGEEFVAVSPRLTIDQAEGLKSRVQNELDHFKFAVRMDTEIPLQASVGIAVFPADGSDLETLLVTSELRLRDDRELRAAVKRGVRNIRTTS